jgi:hypothetical protein
MTRLACAVDGIPLWATCRDAGNLLEVVAASGLAPYIIPNARSLPLQVRALLPGSSAHTRLHEGVRNLLLLGLGRPACGTAATPATLASSRIPRFPGGPLPARQTTAALIVLSFLRAWVRLDMEQQCRSAQHLRAPNRAPILLRHTTARISGAYPSFGQYENIR